MAGGPAMMSVAQWIAQLAGRGAVVAPGQPGGPPPAAPPPTAVPPGSALGADEDAALTVRRPPSQQRKPPPFPAPGNALERFLNDLDGYEQDITYWEGVAADPQYSTRTREEAQRKADAAKDDRTRVNGQIATEAARTQHPARGTPVETIETYGGRQYRVHWTADGVGGKTLDTSKGTSGVEPLGIGTGDRITANGQVYTLSDDGKTATPVAGIGPSITVQERNGQTYYSDDQGRTWKPSGGLPATQQRLQGGDGQYYTLSPDGTTATPISGVGRAVQVQQRGGSTYLSKDGGVTWEPAQGLPTVPSVSTVGGRAVGIDPLTGQQTFSTDLMSPEDRARQTEREGLQDEALRRGQLPANAYAALAQETSRVQAVARQERDRLLELQRQGAISASQAQQQWQQWLGPRQAQLEGLKVAAEEAQRAEQIQLDALQRTEDARVQALNRQREQLGLEAGQTARTAWMGLAPHVRTPQFLQQYGQSVANMAARANAPSAEAAAALPRGSTFTADTFNPANFRAAVPNLDEVARQATARALASISPLAAATINRPMPRFPSPLDLPAMVAQVPYRGPLAALPSPASGLTPTLGMNPAEDIGLVNGVGTARTRYGPTGDVFYDWPIPGGAG
jgi:hypothetical protein